MPVVKILIVDDEVLIAEYLKDILTSLNMGPVQMAHNRQQAMAAIDACMPEIILLDIKMENDMAGISMAEKIDKLYQVPVIFITAYSDKETVEAALKTKPAAYITKPFKPIDIYAAVSIIIKERDENAGRHFVFKDGYDTVRLMRNEILYVEGQGNYVNIVTINKKYVIRQSLDWCAENLPPEQFVRIHRSYIVNQEKIDKVTARYVFINANIIPMARGGRKKLLL